MHEIQEKNKYNYQADIRSLFNMVKNSPDGKAGKILYSIYYCDAPDRNWKQFDWDSNDVNRFYKRCEECITDVQPDALKVEISVKKRGSTGGGKKFFIRITPDVSIFLEGSLVAEDITPTKSSHAGNNQPEKPVEKEQLQPAEGLAGMEGYGGLGAIIEGIEKKFEIRDLEKDNKALAERVKDLEEENGQLFLENEDLNGRISTTDNWKAGIASALTLAAPKLGVKPESIMGLAGMFMGGDEESAPQQALPESVDGIPGASPERTKELQVLNNLLAPLSSEVFNHIAAITAIVVQDNSIVTRLLSAAKHYASQSTANAEQSENKMTLTPEE